MKSLLSLLLPESIFRRMINANPGLVSMTTIFIIFAVFVFKPGIRACLPSNNSVLAPVSRKCRQLFGPEKLFYVCCVCIHDESFNNFDNDKIKLPVKEEKLTGL